MHNLPGKKTLQLSADTIAKIFSGQITMWNDPAIVADNNRTIQQVKYRTNADGTLKKNAKGDPEVLSSRPVKRNYVLPAKKIQVVVRADGSGTTENFTNFLNKSAPSVWTRPKASVFKDSFPGDINALGNLGRIVGAQSSTGVGLQASKTPYSITYNEVNYAKTYKLKVADVINPAGTAVAPDATGTSAFLASATQDANGFLTFDYATKEKGAYTLGIVSYMLVDTNYADKEKAKAVKELAEFILSPKCALDAGEDLGFALITGDFLKKSLAQVAKIK
jgi:phosphate transport system substrate-binding protein